MVFAGVRFFAAGIITLVIYKLFLYRLFNFDKKSNNISDKKLTDIKENKLESKTKKNIINQILLIVIVSFFLTYFQYICFYTGLSNITGVKGSIINSCSSFFTIILASICFKNDRLDFKKALGIILGVLGILLVNFNSLETFDFGFTFKGDGLMYMASLSFAIGSVISKKFSNIIDPVILTGSQLGLGGLFLIITGELTGGKLNHITISGCILLLYMALLSSIAFSLWTILLKYNHASKVSIYNFLNPIFGVILSGIFLKESLSITIILALAMVCFGIYSVNK